MEWADWDDDRLLKIRICDLKLKIRGSVLEEPVAELYRDLEAKGLKLKPKVYLGDEWFSPDGVPAISIPFYLAHPRLRALEKKMMLEVEGGDPVWCMKLLRHETGHCFDHAYHLSRTQKWRKLFGNPNQTYTPESYRPRPYSRSYVRHLDDWYAQAHPDEDFAETFAVWLNPQRDWREEYRGWRGASAKLQYIDEIAQKILSRKNPKVARGPTMSEASRLKSTLERFYNRRRRENAEDYPDFYDRDLQKIFKGSLELSKKEASAVRFLRSHRREILNTVSRWSGARKYTVNTVLKKILKRVDELDLRVEGTDHQVSLELAAFLTSLVTHYKFTGKFKRSV